jgi:hypothetical protein
VTVGLYRLFSADSDLLYVGISNAPMTRFESHSVRPWWPDVAEIRLEHFADRAAALDAERVAIRDERPLHNVQGAVRVVDPVDSVDSVVVTARVSSETYEALRSIADRNYRSISSHVRALIEADVADRPTRDDTEEQAA